MLPVDLVVTAPRCPAHAELTAYFIIAEALTNVVKHAVEGSMTLESPAGGGTVLRARLPRTDASQPSR